MRVRRLPSPSPAELPNLQSLVFGERAFAKLPQLAIASFPALESLAFGPNCFEMLTTLRFSSVPTLTTVSASAYACYNVREVDLFSRCVGSV